MNKYDQLDVIAWRQQTCVLAQPNTHAFICIMRVRMLKMYMREDCLNEPTADQ